MPKAAVEPYLFWRQSTEPDARRPAASATSTRPRSASRVAGKLPARFDYGVEMAAQTGSLGTDDVQRLGRPLACVGKTFAARRPAAAVRRIQLRLRRRAIATDGSARHLRPALSDRPRQVRARRSGRLAEHPSRCAPASSSRRQAQCRSPAAITRGGWPSATDALYSASGALVARDRPPAPPAATSARRSTCRSSTPIRRSCRSPAATRTSSRRVPEDSDAGRVLQLPVRDGHLRVPGGRDSRPSAGEHSNDVIDDATFLQEPPARRSAAAGLMLGLPTGLGRQRLRRRFARKRKTMRFGIIALTDCAPIVMAHELGYFKKFGIDSIVSKEASWAVIRDKLYARREPGDAHADRHAARLDDGAGRLAGEADGHSVAAQPQRPGDHPEQQAEAGRRARRRRR